MELKHLRTFLVLSDLKNFTRTAEHLHYAQSYVTTQIQQLEAELNVRLFERLGRSITLTPDGLALIPYARKIISASEDVMTRFSLERNNCLTIGAAESICINRLPPLITQYKKQYPDIRLHLQILDQENVLSLLEANTIDLAFILDTPVTSPSITTVLQIDETIGAFAAPGHPLAARNLITVHDFDGTPVILTGRDCCYRRQFSAELAKAEVTPDIVLETGSIQAIKQTAISGLGICILPLSAVGDDLARGDLIRLNYHMDYDIHSQLIHHKDKWISDHLANFIDTVRRIISRH